MSAHRPDATGLPTRAIQHTRWLLVALHLPFVAAGPVVAIPRHGTAIVTAALLVPPAVAIGALQLRQSLAVARGERVAGDPWTFVAIAVLVYLPMPWFTWDWSSMQWFVIVSGAMSLPGRLASVAVVTPIVGQALVAGWFAVRDDVGAAVVVISYQCTVLIMGSVALFGSAWLVRKLEDLRAAQTELAELAVGRERLRVSRDLHDLLGQSLSAVSLKGDLALKLLPIDRAAARAEIVGLTDVARAALRDVRAVTSDRHTVRLYDEIDAAVRLFRAAGIDTLVDIDLPPVAREVENVLAWAVREGATNAVRHSDATMWSVSAHRCDGAATLEIANDGAPPSSGGGSGLAGLSERAHAVSGSVSTERTPDGWFRLRVEIPGAAS